MRAAPKTKIKVITLDIFGTLIDNAQALEKSCAKMKVPEAFESCLTKHLQRQRWHHGPFKTMKMWYKLALWEASKELAIDLPVEKCAEILFNQMIHAPAYADAAGFVDNISKYCDIYILSNIDTELLDALGRRKLFQVEKSVSSESVKCYKPNKDIFDAAVKYGTHDRKNHLHIGDMPLFDIWGGNNAGFQTAWIRREPVKNGACAQADFTAKNFDELYKALIDGDYLVR